MIGVVATAQVQPEKAAEFERVAIELEAQVNAREPGYLVSGTPQVDFLDTLQP